MSIDLLVIQATTACNLNCKYCYLPADSRKKSEIFPLESFERVAELVLRSPLTLSPLTVLWHAGEPLAAGIDFYENSIKILEKHNKQAKKLIYSIQTNGLLINQQWCDFFKKHEVEVGISIDGPQHINDINRVGWNGKSSFSRVMKSIQCLRDNKVNYTGICVLTEASLSYPNEIFNFFLENKFKGVGFNLEEIEASNLTSSLLVENKGNKFNRIFEKYKIFMNCMIDLWIKHKDEIYIREFEDHSSKILFKRKVPNFVPQPDVNQGLRILTIRGDGHITTFSPELATGTAKNPDQFVIGHINDIEEVEDLYQDPRYLSLRKSIYQGIKSCQEQCGYFGLCGGGTPSNKYFENGSFSSTETKDCKLRTKTLIELLMNKVFLNKSCCNQSLGN